MRYPDGGGLSPAARERRETVRFQAAQLFAQDVTPVEVAARLRVSTKSAYQWRRRWRAGGEAALASTGPGGASCRAVRRPAGPAAHGAGAWDGRPRLGRSALDPGPDRDADRPAVPPSLHPARHRLSAPTAWASRRSCPGAARG